jgi:hypothetical protein
MDFYCVKCREHKRGITNFERVTWKNGRHAAKAVCPDCGTNMNKIVAAE